MLRHAKKLTHRKLAKYMRDNGFTEVDIDAMGRIPVDIECLFGMVNDIIDSRTTIQDVNPPLSARLGDCTLSEKPPIHIDSSA